ncbi:MAG: H-NS family nucleoid-associated regulatory protein, partial [Pseudomonadota bacterium]|nr:H-NS family nucleoid-associated regulatory protein [Pseudomonadota bacterium]
ADIKKQREDGVLNFEYLQPLNLQTNKQVGKKRPVKFKLVDSKGEEHLWTGIGRMPRVYKEALDSGKSLDDYAIN